MKKREIETYFQISCTLLTVVREHLSVHKAACIVWEENASSVPDFRKI